MKVINVIVGLNVGGAEMALTRQLLCEPVDIHNVSVVSLTDLGVLGAKLQQRGFTVHCLGLNGLLSLLAVFFKLIRIFKREKPDVVQTWMYHADFLGGLAARFVGCKKVYWGIRCTKVPIGSRVTYCLMKCCAFLSKSIPHRIICVAQSAKQSHIEYGYDASKLIVIGNGFETQKFDRQKIIQNGQEVNFKQQDNELVIGCVGRFHPDKGQDILVDAAKQLIDVLASQKADVSLRFVLVGKGCEVHNQSLIDLLRSKQVQNYFTLYGQTDDVPEVLAGFDIFCMPSRTEGFPNGLGEAMAMALPCVATDVGDTQALGGDLVTLVKSHDSDALAKGLYAIVDLSSQQRRSLGDKCAARIKQYYSIESVKMKFRSLFNS